MSQSLRDDTQAESTLHQGQHKDLQTISIFDCRTEKEIIPNSGPVKIDNECFSGELLFMIRTPDVDDPKETVPDGEAPRRISNHLKGYKRRFEFQFQIKLKKVPTGPLFLGCEVEELIKLSRFTKGLTTFLLAMIRRMNSGFHYSWGTDKAREDPDDIKNGIYERTHLSFPVEASMDRIIMTPPGETPPKLGYELHEAPESIRRRKKMGAGSVEWKLDHTYTLGLWSAYMDWMKWRIMNVPGCRPFQLTNVTGAQPIYLCVYELKTTNEEYKKTKPPHNQSDLSTYTRLEFAHRQQTQGGMAPRFGKKDHSNGLPGETDSSETEGGE